MQYYSAKRTDKTAKRISGSEFSVNGSWEISSLCSRLSKVIYTLR